MSDIIICRSPIKLSIVILALCLLMTACGERKSFYIFVVDMSESVSADARRLAFDAVLAQGKTLKRGDSIIIIPVTGDAAVDTSGKIIRLQVREEKRAYDDVTGSYTKEFMTELTGKINEMQQGSKVSASTDLLGALRVAGDEIGMLDRKNSRVFLFVLSDMVHSTKEIRFEKDRLFAKPEMARKFAEKKISKWENVAVYCGTEESSDLRAMPPERREIIRLFWQEFFRLGGAERFEFAADGIGQIPQFIKGANNKS